MSSPQAPNHGSLEHRVLCIGDMTADVLASPVRKLPAPGEVSMTDRIVVSPGGNALNTAIALRRLGESVRLVSSLGDDAFGDMLISQLEALGLDLRDVRREPGCATPTTLVYRTHDEDRRYIGALGAAERFTGEGISPDVIPEDGVLLAAGYLKLRAWNDDALAELFRAARRRRCQVVLNVCLPLEGHVPAERCLRLLPLVDVFVVNEDEARVLTSEPDPVCQAKFLRNAGTRRVIVTRASEGLYAQDGSGVVQMGAFTVPLVDPSGCGDCFNAGLIAGLLRGGNMLETLQLASAVGALAATALGCTNGVPPMADVERFVRENRVEYRTTLSNAPPLATAPHPEACSSGSRNGIPDGAETRNPPR